MASKRVSFTNFNRRLTLAGGREQGGPMAVRRASGVAPEVTTSVLSRWGSTHLYNIDTIQCYYFNGVRYQYDGAALYANGVSIQAAINTATGASGFNGGRLAFNSMPPQPGLNDYLFILGGGVQPFKIDPTGTVTLWGIAPPDNAMAATNIANDEIVIDAFETSAANWTHRHDITSITNDNTEFQVGTASMKINTAGAPWRTINTTVGTLNLGTYSNGDISLQTDIFQIWVFIDNANSNDLTQTWIQLDFDVNDGTFKKDWYSCPIGLVSFGSSNPVVKHNVNFTVSFQQSQWQQLTIAKSQFTRFGGSTQLDWTNVQAIRLSGGHLHSNNIYFDNWTLDGGSAMGAGPTAGNGGVEYDYFSVFRNLTTGSQSNPQPVPSRVFDVSVNKVGLSQIPLSTDAQVGARDLYRTQALTQPGGGVAFFLDTIYDNTTDHYVDEHSDTSFRLATTPWTKSVAVPPNGAVPYYIDAGNGYYFLNTGAGTTGASPPTWNIPTTEWSANTPFILNETIAPLSAAGTFYKVTTPGKSGTIIPNFGSLAATITDGTVVWTNVGLQTTTDNTVTWTFQGINSTPTLGNDQMLLDNAQPLITYGTAVGPYLDSMFWTRDSADGAQGYIYGSPPGRPESVAQQYSVSSSNDPMQTLAIWDASLWGFSSSRVFSVPPGSEYPAYRFRSIDDALGTMTPYCVVPLQIAGILYWAPDGIRVINWAGSRLFGFSELAPIFRGQAEENVAAWSSINPPLWAEKFRDEIVFSDSTTLTLALAYDGLPEGGLAWRQPGPILKAAFYEHQTGSIQASFGGSVYLFEQPGVLADGDTPIDFELQSEGEMPDVGAEFTTQRIYITANPNVSSVQQTLTPILIIDGVEHILPAITAAGRATFELSPKFTGRFFDGVRLTSSLTGRVEIFRVEADVYLGAQSPDV